MPFINCYSNYIIDLRGTRSKLVPDSIKFLSLQHYTDEHSIMVFQYREAQSLEYLLIFNKIPAEQRVKVNEEPP